MSWLKKISNYYWLVILILMLLPIFIFYQCSQIIYLPKTYNLVLRQLHSRQIDGVLISKQEKTSLKPLAVMIENHIDSRPQIGLDKASIVYEAEAEGNITRFLAIFDQGIEADKIGPVRSVRPYFISWAEEWDPVLYHSGGSPSALNLLANSLMWNLDEISANGIYYWRDKERNRPHNLYTSASLMRQSLSDKNINIEANYQPWLFKDDLIESNRPKATEDITIDFSLPEYKVTYKYYPKDNTYLRHVADKPQLMVDGKKIWANNIVLINTTAKVLDRIGRLKVDTESGGEAIIYQDGKEIKGFWEKIDKRTRFYRKTDNEEIRFNRGNIWIEVLLN